MGTMGQSITLANSIIGVGILAMPFCFQQCGVLLATLILLTMGLISRLCCYFLLKSALLARRRNFEFLAFHVFGPAGKLAVEVGIIGFLMGTCIAYFVVVGDLGPQIISKMFNINQSDILRRLYTKIAKEGTLVPYHRAPLDQLCQRPKALLRDVKELGWLGTSIMVIVSLVCVLPLGLLRNVDSLSNVSAATIGFYLCLVIKVIAEAASQLPSGSWRRDMALWSERPAGAVLQCVPIFSMALFCQTQLFEIFESLPSLSLDKMNAVTKTAINICTCVYFTLGLFGYIAFCSQDISGNILMSLSPTMASDVIKLGFVMSLAFSFPLIIFPCRASLYSFLYKKVHSSQHDHIINHSIPETTFRCITVGIIAVALVISLLIPNIELVLGLVGSTIGVLICVVFPAACFVNVTFKNTNERVLAKGVLILGLGIMILGTYANLQAAEKQIDKYDDRFITQEKIDKIVEDFFEKREKVEGNHLKPVPKKDPVVDASNLADIKKDSEVQPPNPVPPESNSIELKSPETNIEKGNLDKSTNDKSVSDVILPEKLKEEAADTISDTHPKNLKIKLNGAKIANGDNNKVKIYEKPEVNYENKVEKIKLIKQQKLIETIKQHGEEQKELMQEQNEILNEIIKNKKEINNEKPEEPKLSKEPPVITDNKHQQLIDTMKQHGEEQRELIQEQKEILDEIIKNKNEINNEKLKAKPSKEPTADVNNKHQQLIETMKQHGEEQKELLKEQKEILDEIKELKQNKNAGSSEANKIAVESIKQIADMAIKSIGDVTKKPAGQQKENKKSERLEKLTHNAVQEIAKKVEETIEAIKEIKEKPEALKPEEPSINKVENEKELPAILYKVETNQKEEEKKEAPAVNLNSLLNNEKVDGGKQTNINKRELQNAPLEPQSKEKIETKVADAIPKNVAIKDDSDVTNAKITNLEQVNVQNVAPIANNVAKELNSIVVAEKQNLNQNIIKPHSHSPDEPQSYKVGEDAQIKNLDNALNQNVPLAVAMSDQAKLETNANKNVQAKPIANPEIKQNIENSNNAKENIISNIETLVRQKRDAIIQKPYEKKSGQWHLQSLDNSIDILPKVDLNDRLSRLPLDPNMLHISRSLKSYDEKEKDSDT